MSDNHIIWDTIITGALVFDGTGRKPQHIDIAIKDGKIASKGSALPHALSKEVVDANGQWLMPGLMDIHTHLDIEVELEPGLSEAVRHGTTTVLVGNCSLGVCFGKQKNGSDDPIVDCFTRVENLPKSVLSKAVEQITWDNMSDYIKHFEDIPLGPNIAAFLPHSMLRVEAMGGINESISRDPNELELKRMESIVEEGMDLGYLGLSTDGLPLHYLANEPNTDKRIPTQYGKHSEYRRLLKVVRNKDGAWQTTAILKSKLKMLLYYAFTSGLLFGKTLRTSALASLEFPHMPRANKLLLRFATLMNTSLFKGKMHFQALGTTFRVWADGVESPVYEELPSACKLIATDPDQYERRQQYLNDPGFIAEFRNDWYEGRRGYTFEHLMTKLGLPEKTCRREFYALFMTNYPLARWNGDSFQQILDRIGRYNRGDKLAARDDAEQAELDKFKQVDALGEWGEADMLLTMLRCHDMNFRFYYDVANVDKSKILGQLLDRNALPGFNDSGAHLTNMAFFDGNLMSLKYAQQDSLETVSKMVKRLTSEPAEFFSLDTGTLEIGAQADIAIIDPEALAKHDDDATRKMIYRDIFEHNQLVSRSDGVVPYVFINGECVWKNNTQQSVLGTKTLGKYLRTGFAKVKQSVKPAAKTDTTVHAA